MLSLDLASQVGAFREGPPPPGWLLAEAPQVSALVEGSGSLRVLRLSPGHVSLAANGHALPLGQKLGLRVMYPGHEVGPVEAEVVSGGEPGTTELRMTAVPMDVGRRILQLMQDLRSRGLAMLPDARPAVEEVISDAARIEQLLKWLFANGSRARFTGASGRWSWADCAGLLAGDELPLRWHGEAGDERQFHTELFGYNSVYRIEGPVHRIANGELAGPMPESIVRLRFRSHRRVPTIEPMEIRFRHPQWSDLEVSRSLREVSQDGLSFGASPIDDVLYPGLDVPEAEVRWKDLQLTLSGGVRYVNAEGPGSACGMRVETRSERDHWRWLDLVNRFLHPSTRTGATWSHHSWKVYEESGYFRLSGKTVSHFLPLQRAYAVVVRRLDAAPQLGCQAVWPSQRGIEASLSLTRMYSGSWLAHQLAKRTGDTPEPSTTKEVLRDIYLRAFEHAQGDPNLRWCLAYAEEAVRWNQLVHLDFARRHEASGRGYVLPFRLMEADCTGPDWPRSPRYELAPAEPAEIAALLAVIEAERPAPYREALDLVEPRFALADLKQEFQRAGFVRDRSVLVARRGGRAMAAAILEVGSTGVNLFRLFDGVRLFALAPGGDDAFAALLAEARRWYQAQGKEAFVYMCERDDRSHATEAGLRDLGAGYQWYLSAELLPEFLEHVYAVTSPKGPRTHPG